MQDESNLSAAMVMREFYQRLCSQALLSLQLDSLRDSKEFIHEVYDFLQSSPNYVAVSTATTISEFQVPEDKLIVVGIENKQAKFKGSYSVEIPFDYPAQPPVIKAISLEFQQEEFKNVEELDFIEKLRKGIEMEVNMFYEDYVGYRGRDLLLSVQIWVLMRCMEDISSQKEAVGEMAARVEKGERAFVKA